MTQKQKSGVSHGGSPKFWGGLISPYGVVMDVLLIITTTLPASPTAKRNQNGYELNLNAQLCLRI